VRASVRTGAASGDLVVADQGVPLEIRRMVREMSIANPLWRAPSDAHRRGGGSQENCQHAVAEATTRVSTVPTGNSWTGRLPRADSHQTEETSQRALPSRSQVSTISRPEHPPREISLRTIKDDRPRQCCTYYCRLLDRDITAGNRICDRPIRNVESLSGRVCCLGLEGVRLLRPSAGATISQKRRGA
jgi:hypothetical protein